MLPRCGVSDLEKTRSSECSDTKSPPRGCGGRFWAHNVGVINDSVPWRNELHRIAKRLTQKKTQKRWVDRSFFLVERDLMIGFFALRRLIEAEKTSSLLPKRRLKVGVLLLTGKEPLHLDRWAPWEFYDFESRQRSELNVGGLLQEVIHSFVLSLSFDEDGVLTGVYVGSDRTKRKRLYLVDMQDIIELFDFVSREDMVWWSWHRINGSDQASYRLSQHDLVAAGFAMYTDEQRVWHVQTSPVTTEYLRTVFPDAREHDGSPLPGEDD